MANQPSTPSERARSRKAMSGSAGTLPKVSDFDKTFEKEGKLPVDINWLSTKAAAGRLGVTPRTLYRIIDAGELPAYRFGRVIRLNQVDVDEHIQRCRVKPGSLSHLYPGGNKGESRS